jgi:gas vesicle protein
MNQDIKMTKALSEREITLKKSASECFNLGQADAFRALALLIQQNGMTEETASFINEKAQEYQWLFEQNKNENDAHLVRLAFIRNHQKLRNLYHALGIPRSDDIEKEQTEALKAINALLGAVSATPEERDTHQQIKALSDAAEAIVKEFQATDTLTANQVYQRLVDQGRALRRAIEQDEQNEQP